MTFTRFVAVDWSGAKGERHRSIAVAACDAGDGAPRLISGDRPWSRGEVFDLIAGFAARGERVLVGIDFSFALPFADRGAYFPGAPSPANMRALWRDVADVTVDDPHHAAHAYVAHRRRHFWTGAADGPRRDFARLRAVERLSSNVTPSSFILLGASQCGKASLSGMRLLAETPVPVWPVDPVPDTGPLLVEIYCRVFAGMGGVRGKIRDKAALDCALAALGSAPADVATTFDDHVGDALISAAGMRAIAGDPRWWSPPGLTPDLARTEGWTFGVA